MPTAPAKKKPTAVATKANPLLADWVTPFQVPPFDAVSPEHFLPAFEAGLAKHNAEIEKIASAKTKPTFQNTIAALENAGRLLGRVSATFWNLAGAHTNDALQAIEREMSPKLAAHWTAIAGNAALVCPRRRSLYTSRRTETRCRGTPGS